VPEEEVKEEEKGSSKLIIIIAAVVVLGGGGAAFMMMGGGDKGAEEEAKSAPKVEIELSKLKEDITISFQDEDSQNFLLISFSYQTKTQETKDYLDKKQPLIRNLMNTYLLSLEGRDIKAKDGITKVKDRIFTVLSKVAEKGDLGKEAGIEDVYIEKYIIQ
jgi:flagellar FliL protein